MREALKDGRSDDHVAGISGDYPLDGDLCIESDSTRQQTAADTRSESETATDGETAADYAAFDPDVTNSEPSEVTDGGKPEKILSTHSDQWYVPDSVVYNYAVRTPDRERHHLKTKAGVTDPSE